MRKNIAFLAGIFFTFVFLSFEAIAAGPDARRISIRLPASAHVRLQYGAGKLMEALQGAGYRVKLVRQEKLSGGKNSIIIGLTEDPWLGTLSAGQKNTLGKEGFSIRSLAGNNIVIGGADYSGALYGCLELADRVRETGSLPEAIDITDQPEMVLRGACIGVQKPIYLPGRTVYEYPYTPESFPWLYDKALWLQYLDSLVENRMNSLYLWNGHPFASLIRLKEYPYAVEVDDSTFKKNEELFSFLTREADKRGIWVIQAFYNIIVSKPFAEKHGIKTQDRERPIVPLIADYTRKSIAAFVEKYPNVGLMVTLGEAMEGVGQDDIDWFTQTIIPGVKDGLNALGKTEEPPIVLRAHDTDAPAVMKAALRIYKNLYTSAKYNGEALTTYTPRGPWAELHRKLSRIGTVQIENVHILANLEPFRYGSADFIQKSVQAMHGVYEANGLHLFPQASYWDWPYSADQVSIDGTTGAGPEEGRLLQVERDWVWYKAWARYAWNCHRDRQQEITYWGNLLGNMFGAPPEQGKEILTAYEESGEIAPKLLRRFGITDGNRQTLTLGMFMNQLINPYRFGLFTLLYNSEGPEGEMLIEYAEKEWKKEKHIGETPVQIIREVTEHGRKAVEAIEKAAPSVTRSKAEFERIRNDMYCYRALADNFAEKAKAALWVLNYKYSGRISDLDSALPHLEKSLLHYKELASLTKGTYLYANSMQTGQRKIPIGGNNGKNKTWVEMVPYYERELATFRHKLDSLKGLAQGVKAPAMAGTGKEQADKAATLLRKAPVTLLSQTQGDYSVAVGQQMFSDTMAVIRDYAPELAALQGIRFTKAEQMLSGTELRFSTDRPVKLLVGFFNKKRPDLLSEPELETNASANDYGQAETKIANALTVTGFPPVNIHTYSFKPGTHTLKLAKGACMVLGFVDEDQLVKAYDAGRVPGVTKLELDWLFE